MHLIQGWPPAAVTDAALAGRQYPAVSMQHAHMERWPGGLTGAARPSPWRSTTRSVWPAAVALGLVSCARAPGDLLLPGPDTIAPACRPSAALTAGRASGLRRRDAGRACTSAPAPRSSCSGDAQRHWHASCKQAQQGRVHTHVYDPGRATPRIITPTTSCARSQQPVCNPHCCARAIMHLPLQTLRAPCAVPSLASSRALPPLLARRVCGTPRRAPSWPAPLSACLARVHSLGEQTAGHSTHMPTCVYMHARTRSVSFPGAATPLKKMASGGRTR